MRLEVSRIHWGQGNIKSPKKAGYMTAAHLNYQRAFVLHNAGRTIYDPENPDGTVANRGLTLRVNALLQSITSV